MCLGGEFKTRPFAIFLLFGQSLWLSRSGGCRGAAKRWVFGTTRSRLSREIAREMGLDFRGFMNCSWRNWLCFLAAEKAPFCLLVGKTCQGWCFLRACPCAPSREGERVLVRDGRRCRSMGLGQEELCPGAGVGSTGCPCSAEPLVAWLGLGSWVALGKHLPGLSRKLLQEESAGQVVLLG